MPSRAGRTEKRECLVARLSGNREVKVDVQEEGRTLTSFNGFVVERPTIWIL